MFTWSWVGWCTTSPPAPKSWGSKPGDSACISYFLTYLPSSSKPSEQLWPRGTTFHRARSSEVNQICKIHLLLDSRANLVPGLHIYMGGVGLQQFFICWFVGLAILFQRQMKRDTPITEQRRALRMLFTLYAVLLLITVSSTTPKN